MNPISNNDSWNMIPKTDDSLKPVVNPVEANIPTSDTRMKPAQPLHNRDIAKTTCTGAVPALLTECLILPAVINNITNEKTVECLTDVLKLRNVTVKSECLEFDLDMSKYKEESPPSGIKDKSLIAPEYAILRSILNSIHFSAIDDLIEKNPTKPERQLLDIAKNYPNLPVNSSFDLNIDPERGRVGLTLKRHARANTHFVGNEPAPTMKMLKIFEAGAISSRICDVLPAYTCQCVVTNLLNPDAPDFLSTHGLADCTAVILHDPVSCTASLTHYWTQSIEESILKKQVELTVSYGALHKNLKAIVVGGMRANLWAPSGYFKCIEPTFLKIGIPIVETSIGQNRPVDIIFDVRSCRVYGLMKSDCNRKLIMSCCKRESDKKVEWSNMIQYYLNDNSSKNAALSCVLGF